MMTRRTLIESAAVLLMLGRGGPAQATGQGRSVFQHDLPNLTLDDWSVTAVEVTSRPGQSSPPHRHPGITIAYVLDGEISSKVGDDPEKTYSVGEMFLETPQQLHAVSRNASDTRPARLLALLLAKKGQPLTTREIK